VGNNFNPQYPTSLVIHLQRKAAKVDLEHGQVIGRLIHYPLASKLRFPLTPFMVRTLLPSEDAFDLAHIQQPPRAVNHPSEYFIENGGPFKQQVPTVLLLVTRMPIVKPRTLLLLQGHGKAQATRLNPTLSCHGRYLLPMRNKL
jgi:hypothetical protein